MDDFKDQVKRGFQNCRLDIEDLKEENSILKNQIEKLMNTVQELKSELKGVNIALDYIKDFNNSNKKDNFENNIDEPSQLVLEELNLKKEKERIDIKKQQIIVDEKKSFKEDPYQALLAFKAKTNKRDVLKQKMVSFITQSGINLSELKFLFVDHYKYCSKATFYNYLKELELERHIKIERENSRNFVFLYNNENKLSKEI